MPEIKNPLANGFMEAMEVATKGTNAGSYPLSKIAVIEIVKDLAWAWGEKGAHIASISPGTINTAMGRAEKEESDMMAVLLAHTPWVFRKKGQGSIIQLTVAIVK